MARLALLDAQERGFATSFVVVSDNDLKFHRFDDVYRKVMTMKKRVEVKKAQAKVSSSVGVSTV